MHAGPWYTRAQAGEPAAGEGPNHSGCAPLTDIDNSTRGYLDEEQTLLLSVNLLVRARTLTPDTAGST